MTLPGKRFADLLSRTSITISQLSEKIFQISRRFILYTTTTERLATWPENVTVAFTSVCARQPQFQVISLPPMKMLISLRGMISWTWDSDGSGRMSLLRKPKRCFIVWNWTCTRTRRIGWWWRYVGRLYVRVPKQVPIVHRIGPQNSQHNSESIIDASACHSDLRACIFWSFVSGGRDLCIDVSSLGFDLFSSRRVGSARELRMEDTQKQCHSELHFRSMSICLFSRVFCLLFQRILICWSEWNSYVLQQRLILLPRFRQHRRISTPPTCSTNAFSPHYTSVFGSAFQLLSIWIYVRGRKILPMLITNRFRETFVQLSHKFDLPLVVLFLLGYLNSRFKFWTPAQV